MKGLHLVRSGRVLACGDLVRGAEHLMKAAAYVRDVYYLEGYGWFGSPEHWAYQILDSIAEEILQDIERARLSQ
jgi:hypothetical protein